MARATQRYDFSTFAAPVALTQVEVIDFLRSTIDPAHRERFVEVARLEQALEARMRQINARAPAIDGKSTNPFVLAAYAHLFDIRSLKQVDEIVSAAKVFSSIETAAGRVVEDVIPPSSAGGRSIHLGTLRFLRSIVPEPWAPQRSWRR